ncbi:hypothetical protein HZS_3375 [Henneguya salminicola]|nr:hypothetical protein HZS_3375 [Henneguya salminicola]
MKYGGSISDRGPWVFCMAECHRKHHGSYCGEEVRLFLIKMRNTQTMMKIIWQQGSIIWWDEEKAYLGNCRNNDGLIHETVSHRKMPHIINNK